MSERDFKESVTHKFVLTEREAFLRSRDEEGRYPDFSWMLGKIFDLDDPEVFESVDLSLSEGRIVLGYWNPSAGDVDIHLPLEITYLMGTRLREVFGKLPVMGAGDEYPRSEYLESERMESSDADYIEDLIGLREIIWEGNFGYSESRSLRENPEKGDKYKKLSKIYPEAYEAFGGEWREEMFRRTSYSPYIEKMRDGLPDTNENRKYLQDIKSMRHKMILTKVGYGGQGLGMMLHSLKTRYPQACEAFEGEIREQQRS